MSVDPKVHGMNVYRSMLEDENAHLEDAVRTGIAAAVEEVRRELAVKTGEAAALWDGFARLRALTVDDPSTIYHEHEKLRLAIVAHRERWTSVNSGDIKQNARPADLELWEVLDDPA